MDSSNTGVPGNGTSGTPQNSGVSANSQISPMVTAGPRQNVSAGMHHPATNGMPPSILPPSMNMPQINDEPTISNWSQSQPTQPINNGTGIWENGGNKDPRLAQGYLYLCYNFCLNF